MITRQTMLTRSRAILPGLGIATTVAAASTYLSEHYTAPVMLFALLLGMSLRFLSENHQCKPGIAFSAKHLLRIGVALLGLRISFGDVSALGASTAILILTTVAITITAGMIASRAFGLTDAFGLIAGGATAICGASAALALSASIPASRQKASDAAFTIVCITAFSTVAMIVYPIIASKFGLDGRLSGIFIGATIHDVAQVVGAGYAISPEAGDVATVVKLFRVALLLPVVFIVSMIYAKGGAEPSSRTPVPWFALAFAVLICVHSARILPAAIEQAGSVISRWCLVIAISAVGLTTSLEAISELGWRPIALIVVSTVVLLGSVLFGLMVLLPY